jgi:phosphatidylglycerophosphatase A
MILVSEVCAGVKSCANTMIMLRLTFLTFQAVFGYYQKKKRDNEDREKDGNKIVIDNNIQNKMIVFFSCLIIVDKIK